MLDEFKQLREIPFAEIRRKNPKQRDECLSRNVRALLLSTIGIYGVISYAVSERSHEFGLRIALGAQAGDVLQMVLRQGLILSVTGVAIGLTASLGVTSLLSNFLYGVRPYDPLTLVLVSVFLIGITILATYVPAHRAANVDPMVTLRRE